MDHCEFLNKKYFLIFFNIDENDHALNISKKTNLTYSYTVSLINDMIDINLITTKKVGRKKVLKLTKRGLRIKCLLFMLSTTLCEIK